MKVALETESSPLDANLESVLPGLHQWHTANNAALKRLQTDVTSLESRVDSRVDGLKDFMEAQQEEHEDKLLIAFSAAARSLLGKRHSSADSSPVRGRGPAVDDPRADAFDLFDSASPLRIAEQNRKRRRLNKEDVSGKSYVSVGGVKSPRSLGYL